MAENPTIDTLVEGLEAIITEARRSSTVHLAPIAHTQEEILIRVENLLLSLELIEPRPFRNGLCARTDEHDPHEIEGHRHNLGYRTWCTANPEDRLPYAAERRRRLMQERAAAAEEAQD